MLVINLAIMRSKPKHCTLKFKQKALELSYAKGNVKQVSEDLDIFPSVLYPWQKELKDYGKNSFLGRGKPKMTDDEKEISRLKKELKEAELAKGRQHPLQERQEKYRFIKQHLMRFTVEKMCTMLAVSKSGYYHWLQSGPSKLWSENQRVTTLIKAIFKDSFQSYGSP